MPTEGEAKVVIDILTQRFYVYRGDRLVGVAMLPPHPEAAYAELKRLAEKGGVRQTNVQIAVAEPRLEDKRWEPLFDLLDVPNNAGVTLTESFAMWPGASVCGLYFSHPDAYYFGVAALSWFLHPVLMMIVTAGVVYVLHQREFRSKTLVALLGE